MDLTKYELLGIDTTEGLERFMQNEALYTKYLNKFKTAPDYGCLVEAIKEKDFSKAFTYAHNIKGVSGNLSIKPVYTTICVVVEMLRNNNMDGFEEAFKAFELEYKKIIENL